MSGPGDSKVNRAVAWVGAASGVVALFDAASLAILLWHWVAREDLGIATFATTLFYFMDLVTEGGMTSVLIQRPALDEPYINRVFWLNVFVSAAAFVALLGIAPLIGAIQGAPIVGWLLIAYGTKLLYQNIFFVPAALMRRELRFKEISVVRTLSNAGDGITKIVVAAMGEPVWCFVAGPLVRILITGIGLQICHPWRPRGRLDLTGSREILAYAAKTTASQYLQHFYNNIHYQVVGYFFGAPALGAYRVAYDLVLYPINWVSNVVAQVAFPALAQLRTSTLEMKAQFLRFSRQNLTVALPLLVILMVAASEISQLLFPSAGDIATAVRVLCVVGLLRAVDCLYLPLLDALGLAGRNVVVAGIAAVVLTAGDVASAHFLGARAGFTAVAIGRMAAYPIAIGVHMWIALHQIHLTFRAYLRELGGMVACAAISLVPGLVVGHYLAIDSAALRLLVMAGASFATLAILFAVLYGISLRSLVRDNRK